MTAVEVRTDREDRARPESASSGPAMPRARPDVYYRAITERPLFAPDRRPVTFAEPSLSEPAEPKPVVADAFSPRPELRLLGVMRSTRGARALLAFPDGAQDWFAEGASIAGWAVTDIEADRIVLTEDGRQFTLEMYDR